MSKFNLRVGDRCAFNQLGKLRNPKIADKLGTVLSVMRGVNKIAVLLDGNKTAATFHRSYFDPIEEADERITSNLQTPLQQ